MATTAADSFVSAAKENSADIVAMSALLTTTMVCLPTVVEALQEAGLKDKAAEEVLHDYHK